MNDITGKLVNGVEAVAFVRRDAQRRQTIWRFRCHCGVEFENVAAEFNRGSVKSCGCLTAALRATNRTHGMTSHPAYLAWRNMRQRCRNPESPAYRYYGGRGIEVCDRWAESFEAFWSDVGATYQPGLTLDRIDNEGDYEPGNVRWATWSQQMSNRRRSLLLLLDRTGKGN